MYKVIGAVIYTINDEYICIEYMGLLQENLSKKNDYKNKIKDFSGLGISYILMNIMSYHRFSNSSI